MIQMAGYSWSICCGVVTKRLRQLLEPLSACEAIIPRSIGVPRLTLNYLWAIHTHWGVIYHD